MDMSSRHIPIFREELEFTSMSKVVNWHYILKVLGPLGSLYDDEIAELEAHLEPLYPQKSRHG